MNNIITRDKLDKYFSITGKALEKVKNSFDENRMEHAELLFDMANRYYNDARFFFDEKDDTVLAFAALNYAHGWLDAGARIGLFIVDDSTLFTVRDE